MVKGLVARKIMNMATSSCSEEEFIAFTELYKKLSETEKAYYEMKEQYEAELKNFLKYNEKETTKTA